MHSNKLILLLNSLSRREMTRFQEFAHSPYHNKHQGVRALVDYLSSHYPNLDEKRCARTAIFHSLFPGEAHDQARLAVLFTYTMRLAEQFLAEEQFREEPDTCELFLLQQLRNRKQYRHYESCMAKAEKDARGAALRGNNWHYRLYRLAEEAEQYANLTSEHQTNSLQQKQHFLDRFYIAEKLRDGCEMIVRSRILRVEYTDRLGERMAHEAEQHFATYGKDPAIAVYFRVYQMVSHNENRYYFEALQALEAHQAFLPVEELKGIYNYFQNYCIQKINQGEEAFLGEIFKLYKAQLDRELLLEDDGYLREWNYKNIVTTALRLGELEWVRQFIENYRHQLPPEARENAYRFNLASYYYAARAYHEVLQLLTQVEYSDLRYNLGAKALLLRTYFDLEEYEALYSLVDSFKQYLHRNKRMAEVRRQGYYNLFKLTGRAAQLSANLAYYSADRRQRDLQKLQQAINRAGAIFNKSWLLEKVSKLEADIGALAP